MSSLYHAQPIQQPSSTDYSIASPALNVEEGMAPAPPPVPSVEGGVAPASPPADRVNHPSDDLNSESGDDNLRLALEWQWAKTLKDIGLHVCSPFKYKLIIII